MSERREICALCGGRMESGTTTFAVDLRVGVAVVRDVPALVCDQCGEAFIDHAAAARLGSSLRRARNYLEAREVSGRPALNPRAADRMRCDVGFSALQ